MVPRSPVRLLPSADYNSPDLRSSPFSLISSLSALAPPTQMRTSVSVTTVQACSPWPIVVLTQTRLRYVPLFSFPPPLLPSHRSSPDLRPRAKLPGTFLSSGFRPCPLSPRARLVGATSAYFPAALRREKGGSRSTASTTRRLYIDHHDVPGTVCERGREDASSSHRILLFTTTSIRSHALFRPRFGPCITSASLTTSTIAVLHHYCPRAVVRRPERRLWRGRPRDGRRAKDRVIRVGPHPPEALGGHPHRALWGAISGRVS